MVYASLYYISWFGFIICYRADCGSCFKFLLGTLNTFNNLPTVVTMWPNIQELIDEWTIHVLYKIRCYHFLFSQRNESIFKKISKADCFYNCAYKCDHIGTHGSWLVMTILKLCLWVKLIAVWEAGYWSIV